MKNLINTILIFFVVSANAWAQQLPISNLYDQNRLIFNPANAGDANGPEANIHHRQQWMGLQGAPMTQIINVHSPIGEYVGVGGMIQNTKTNILRQTSVHLNYAYGVDVAFGHRINFGLGAVYHQNALDLNNVVVQDQNEISMYAANFNGSAFNFDFGIRYNWDNLEVGISANQLLNNRLNSFSPNDNRFNQFRTHFNGIASYKYKVESLDLILKPTVLVRYIPHSGTLNDYVLNVDWKNLVWGNLGYRDGRNFIFSAGTWVTNNIGLSYSYNYSTELLSMESFGSHEIALKINLKSTDGEGPFKTNERTGELTEREKALIEAQEKKKAERDALKAQKEQEKAKSTKTGKQTITIETDGFEVGTDEIIIKPGSKKSPSSELEELKNEMSEINSKIDAMLKSDYKTEASRGEVLEEIRRLKERLQGLLKSNDPENVHEVSNEIEDIQKKIEALKLKLN